MYLKFGSRHWEENADEKSHAFLCKTSSHVDAQPIAIHVVFFDIKLIFLKNLSVIDMKEFISSILSDRAITKFITIVWKDKTADLIEFSSSYEACFLIWGEMICSRKEDDC